jgi:hypothetical protein
MPSRSSRYAAENMSRPRSAIENTWDITVVVAGMRLVRARFRRVRGSPRRSLSLQPQGFERGIVEVPAAVNAGADIAAPVYPATDQGSTRCVQVLVFVFTGKSKVVTTFHVYVPGAVYVWVNADRGPLIAHGLLLGGFTSTLFRYQRIVVKPAALLVRNALSVVALPAFTRANEVAATQ